MQRLVNELNSAGYRVDQVIPDGKFHRFKVDDKDDKQSGYYKAFQNISQKSGATFYVMIYGSWRDGNMSTFNTMAGIHLDKHDKARIREQMDKAHRELQAEREELQKRAAQKAEERFNTTFPGYLEVEYFRKKGITELYGTRVTNGDVLVPMRDIEGKIKNIETIYGNGELKKGMFGGQRLGLMHVIGSLGDIIYLCEGFSTGVAIYKAMQTGVVCCFNSANLVPVSQEIFKKYPNAKIVICGDNDQYPNKNGTIENAGVAKAKEAANICGGKYIIPEFESTEGFPTDFDDLMRREGIDAVKNQILDVEPDQSVEIFDSSYIVNAPYPDENIKSGNKKGTNQNVYELMRRLRIISRYNVISKEEDILIPGEAFTMDNQKNAKLAYITDWCNRVGIPTQNLSMYLTAIADQNLYNPVITWIESKPWDGRSRLDEFFSTIKAKNEDKDAVILALKQTVMKRWMISAVAAAYEPNGISAHGVLVLQGSQYSGKTYWFKKLAPKHLDVLKDGVTLDPRDKDSVFQVISSWIVELGELDSTFKKADLGALKAFITKDCDIIRRPYAVKESHYARRTVFFASVNEKDFLKDPTGNRRFWTIACESINYLHEIDMQQVWAEIAGLYKSGESWYLTREEMDAMNGHNESFTEVDPVDERIRSYFDWSQDKILRRKAMTCTEVCMEIGIQNPTMRDKKAAGGVLRKLCGEPRPSNGREVFDLPKKKDFTPQ